MLLCRGIGVDLEVLLQLRGPAVSYMAGHWASAAAGHVELGESVFAAAVRELTEELGVYADPGHLEPLTVLHRTQFGDSSPIEQRADFFFTLRSWGGDPRIAEPDKCTELRWVSPSRLPDPTVPHEARVLRALAAGAVPAVMTAGFDGPPAAG